MTAVSPNSVKIAVITDIHYKGEEDRPKLEKLCAAIMKENVDIVLQTGDLVDDKGIEVYKTALKIIKNKVGKDKLLNALGDHDRKNAKPGRFAFIKKQFVHATKHPSTFYSGEKCGITFVTLCSRKDARPYLEERQKQICLLERVCKTASNKIIIMLHHPVTNISDEGLRAVGGKTRESTHILDGRDEIQKIVRENPNIIAIVTGHLHANDIGKVDEVPNIVVCSATKKPGTTNVDTENSNYSIITIYDEKLTVETRGDESKPSTHKFRKPHKTVLREA